MGIIRHTSSTVGIKNALNFSQTGPGVRHDILMYYPKHKDMEDVSKAAFVFSKLTEINLRRSDRYTAAAEKVRNVYQKTMFMNYAYHAQQLIVELNRWLAAYKVNFQPKPENIIKTSWEKLKDVFVRESENSIYADCESFEEEAVRGYNTAIALSFIPPKAMKEVQKHIQHIEKIRVNLKTMKGTQSKLHAA